MSDAAAAAAADAAREEDEEEDEDEVAPLGRRTRNAALQARCAPQRRRSRPSALSLHRCSLALRSPAHARHVITRT
jgi:hypothetical protein